MALALNAVAAGTAMVTENVYESRFTFVNELGRLGADIRTDGHHAIVRGRPMLSGAPVRAPDIRAGAGLVIAGLVADGETVVTEHPPHRPRLPAVRRAAAHRWEPTSSASRTPTPTASGERQLPVGQHLVEPGASSSGQTITRGPSLVIATVALTCPVANCCRRISASM